MLDDLYNNLDNKLQTLAKWTFVLGAIVSIIAGLILLINLGFEDGWWALFVIILGPIMAWISSWPLYALGQLIENTRGIRGQNSKIDNIDSYVQTTVTHTKHDAEEKTITKSPVKLKVECTHRWFCNNCKQLRTQSPCEYCGKD